ncbi:hypothetical protein [Pseudalkalibacillus caeni]|uniref:hypothetical protein n=1 Tax=Exobacillus caeni TaxID=2574798 RepID=UPI001485A7B3|nr:hypothetical protein [Pseudalkalibacillus caeni]
MTAKESELPGAEINAVIAWQFIFTVQNLLWSGNQPLLLACDKGYESKGRELNLLR